MSKLQIFKQSKSLISSKLLSKFSASDISMQLKPLDLACASLVQLSFVKLAAVSILINQSSNCVESFPLKIVISWNRVLAKLIFFCAVHKVSVYCWRTSSRGSDGAEGWSAEDSLWSSSSRQFIVSVGWFVVILTLCYKWSSSFVNSFNHKWFSCSIFSKSSMSSW